MAEEKSSVSERLSELKDRSGLSLRAIAREMGYQNASSIQRYFSPDYGKDSLPADFVAKLLPILIDAGEPAITQEEVLALGPETIIDLRSHIKDNPAPAGLTIRSDVAAGHWLEANIFEDESHELTTISGDTRYKSTAQFLVRVRGQSMNEVAQDGDLLLCLDYMQNGNEIKSGDIVVIERSRDGGSTIERTAKRVVITEERIELWPQSTDPRFQEPIIYNDQDEETTEVRIIAKVLMVIRMI